MTEDLRRRFKFFHAHGGWIVGQRAICAWDLAKAERRAEGDELEIVTEPDWDVDLSWDDDGSVAAKLNSGEYECAVVTLQTESGEWLESLGGVIAAPGDPYWRVVGAELASEHYYRLDKATAEATARFQATAIQKGW